eukprot:scaffold1518_cov417-Prasinococcus_capsulatus_cf.AAC.21
MTALQTASLTNGRSMSPSSRSRGGAGWTKWQKGVMLGAPGRLGMPRSPHTRVRIGPGCSFLPGGGCASMSRGSQPLRLASYPSGGRMHDCLGRSRGRHRFPGRATRREEGEDLEVEEDGEPLSGEDLRRASGADSDEIFDFGSAGLRYQATGELDAEVEGLSTENGDNNSALDDIFDADSWSHSDFVEDEREALQTPARKSASGRPRASKAHAAADADADADAMIGDLLADEDDFSAYEAFELSEDAAQIPERALEGQTVGWQDEQAMDGEGFDADTGDDYELMGEEMLREYEEQPKRKWEVDMQIDRDLGIHYDPDDLPEIEEEEEDTGPRNPENYVNQIEDDEVGTVFGIDNKRYFKEDWEKVPEWEEFREQWPPQYLVESAKTDAPLSTVDGTELVLKDYKRFESQDKLDFLFRRDGDLIDLKDAWLRLAQPAEEPEMDRSPYEDLLDLNTEEYDELGTGLARYLDHKGEVDDEYTNVYERIILRTNDDPPPLALYRHIPIRTRHVRKPSDISRGPDTKYFEVDWKTYKHLFVRVAGESRNFYEVCASPTWNAQAMAHKSVCDLAPGGGFGFERSVSRRPSEKNPGKG